MAEEAKGSRAAGWKQDPSGRFAGRFWDGSGWTEHVVGHDKVTSIDPVPVDLRRPAKPPEGADAPIPGGPTAHPDARRGWPGWAKIVLPLAVVVAIGVGIATVGEDDPSPGATAAPTAEASTVPGKSIYAVGETARTGDFDVTVHGFTDPQTPGEILPPREGMHYVSVDVELTNRGSRTRAFSSLLGFLLIDSADQEFDASFGDVSPPAPDGDVAPGKTVRGLALFEVPDGTGGFRVRVRASLTVPGALFALG